jgi:hypothetical protein
MKSTPPLIHLNYPFDFELLKSMAEQMREKASNWDKAETYQIPQWKISICNNSYLSEIMNNLGIDASPRFVYHSPNYLLKPHVDLGTWCSVNVIINQSSVPLIFEGTEYYYSQALLDVQRSHSVYTLDNERVFLKFSIKNQTFLETLSNKKFSRFCIGI